MTNSTFEFISQLKKLKINLETDGDRLRCQAPPGALTPTISKEIGQRKQEIIAFLQDLKHDQEQNRADGLAISKAPRDGNLPLSFAQQRLWVVQQIQPDSTAYNMLEALYLQGAVDVVALETSLSELLNRHEVLRTSFPTMDDSPIQLIAPPTGLTLPIQNLQGLSEQEQTEQIREIGISLASTPVDLAVGPLVEFVLLQLQAQEYVLLIKMHHIIYDGWSLNIFFSELSQLYTAFSQGLPSPLPELQIQYADFAVWQRQWLTDAVLERQINYWQKQLEGVPSVLELPCDRPRPPVQTFQGGMARFKLDSELSQQLKKFSQEFDVTLFITLLSAFIVLVSRYSGQLDLVVGSPIANRNNLALEKIMGFFVNTLVLRGDLSKNPTFAEFLAQMRTTTLSAYSHQDLPFETLVDKLHPVRDLSRNPLVQVVFALQNAPMSASNLPGLTIENMSLPLDLKSRFDLEVNYWEIDGGLEGVWSYSSDLFDASTIARIAKNFETLLWAIATNPQTKVSELPLLSATERHQILVDWNNTCQAYPQDKCIHELFAEQVEKTPDAIAVVFANQQLTYRELNNKANQLAHHLQSLGVKADTLVGICVERSVEMVIGLLGIFKAGGAYVPIDPSYPAERKAFILADTQTTILLTQQHLTHNLSTDGIKVICLDADWSNLPQQTQNPVSATNSQHLAYVIYTSGSTGKPKGTLIPHQGLVNYLSWCTQAYEVKAGTGTIVHSPLGFDLTITSLFSPLLVGNQVEILPQGEDVENLSHALHHHSDLSLVKITPAHLELLNQQIPATEAANRTRSFIIGGDNLLAENIAFWREFAPETKLVNEYGPTETVVGCCIYEVPRGKHFSGSVPIGRPIANTQLYILDQNLQPVPIMGSGELHIGGAGLARGYLNRPELTAEKFIPNPFDNGKTKLYKTGDLARYLPDGNIEYLGRIDNQVKIRGFRIELGEIEAVLNQHQEIKASCVIAREDIPGKKRLVGYIVAQAETTLTTSQLRQYLKNKLPEYMIPSTFVYLESLPLTSNGKIDNRALPEPETRAGIEEDLVSPNTPIEAKLVEIWALVLGVEKVGINDNFFELGGDSILSIQIIAKAKQAGIEITLKQLFGNQTIAELAAVAGTTKTLKIEQGIVRGKLPLTPIQQWFFEQAQSEKHHFNQAFLLSVPADIDREKLEQVWRYLLNHHDALRLRFTKVNEEWIANHAEPSESFKIEYFDISEKIETEQPQVIEDIANKLQASLDLESHLVKVGLFKLGENKPGRLLIVIHHLVVDGVSWRILLEDLETGYQQLSQNQKIKLPAKTTSFKNWSQHLREYAQTEELKSELAYWLQTSNNEVSNIPVDKPKGENTIASAEIVSVSLTADETTSLLQEVPTAYKTQINDILLTALVLVLSKWTNSKSVIFNLEGHGREDIIEGVDLSRTIGWFTTLFPVVLKLETTKINNLENVIKSVKEQLRSIPNKGIGYGVLRYLSKDENENIKQQIAKIPTAEINFNYLGQFTQTLNTSSLISPANESSGELQSLASQRSALLEVNAFIAEEQLQISWIYSNNIHHQITIEQIAQEFLSTLQELISHCLDPENSGYTPTDFPLIDLDQSELDQILQNL
ncbi:amino acid adenylation domain-containing protein [Okeanomitos corallinicola TIOX110]|uniref:Amino acid adenylation domain-containing protein n=1 Tax=Okeanomitos corallinicola TIOX110 TaxID=3133117 RepID=A0ABZ2USY6_9CYAN